MLETIPTITQACMTAQEKIAKRLPPHLYIDQMLGILEHENPVIYEWILAFGKMVDKNVEERSEKAWLKFIMLANLGIVYSAIKAQIEGDCMDLEYGTDLDTQPDDKSAVKPRPQPRRSSKGKRRKK